MTSSAFILTSLIFLWPNFSPEEVVSSATHAATAETAVSLATSGQCKNVSPPVPSPSPSNQTKITGVVVAVSGGIVLTDGLCRQSMVVRVTRREKWKPKNPYILVRRDFGCDAKPLPTEIFQAKRTWRFILARDSSCDHTFEEIKDLVAPSPASGPYRIPVMKMVPGNEGEKMPTTRKLACYRLTGELKPAGK